jgi:hypothetical protein
MGRILHRESSEFSNYEYSPLFKNSNMSMHVGSEIKFHSFLALSLAVLVDHLRSSTL